jgi:hypothetical protein
MTTPCHHDHHGMDIISTTMVNACDSFHVVLFENDHVGLAQRRSPPKLFSPPNIGSSSSCTALCQDSPVNIPPRPSSGICNVSVREGLLSEYRKNPLVYTVSWTLQSPAHSNEPPASSRHFLGFGFSKESPYLPPGTIIHFVETRSEEKTSVTVTGMVAAYGKRYREYAVILSLDKEVHPDAVSAFMDSFNITEIDGCGEEGYCDCLSEIIRKYTHTVGDVDPACASTDSMQRCVMNKFHPEMQRMLNAVQLVAASHPEGMGIAEIEKRTQSIHSAFRMYRESLLMQMRHQPLGTREWIQTFETYMSFASSECGLGFLDFVFRY